MPVSTRPIRDVLVERELADDAAAFDVATVIGEVVDESQSELMTKADGRALIAEVRELFGKIDAKLDALDAKIDGVEAKLEAKIDGVEARLDAKIDTVEAKLEAKIDGVDAKIDKVEARLDAKIDKVDAKIDTVDAKADKRIAELEARNAERQSRIYRFILLVGTAATTIVSIVAAVT